MSAETGWVDAWLDALLSGDATLYAMVGRRVSNTPPLAGVTLPCICYLYQPRGADLVPASGASRLSRLPYRILAVGKAGEISALRTIDARLEQLLAGTIAETAYCRIRVARQAPIELPDVGMGGTRYCQLGADWRIYVSPI